MQKGRFAAREARTPADMERARDLRALAFGVAGAGADDGYDAGATHVLIEDRDSGALLCCYRLRAMATGNITSSCAAQFYDLAALVGYGGTALELGRFCLHPDQGSADVIRLAWAVLTRHVDARGIGLLFGCASFAGTDPAPYATAFDRLAKRHLAPTIWRPGRRAPRLHALGAPARDGVPQLPMPPLLRTYLMMGGWVSDHAVIDPEMNTLHVFTGLETCRIDPARKKLLRALV